MESTRTFVVYFDDQTNLIYEEEDASNIVTITLTGTHEQMAGFLCLFFARYGEEGWYGLSEDLRTEFQTPHWHDADDAETIISLNQRYVMTNFRMTELTTSDLAQFVSGMKAVPNIGSSHIEVGDTMRYQDSNWKNEFHCLDLGLDDVKDAYRNPDNEDPWRAATNLATIDTSGIKPLVTKFEAVRITDGSQESESRVDLLCFE
jgi:hypothetical protein